METVAIVFAWLFTMLVLLRRVDRVEQTTTASLQRYFDSTNKIIEQGFVDLRKDNKVLHASLAAYAEVFARMDDAGELPFFNYHFEAVSRLYALRARGVSEEEIVTRQMCYHHNHSADGRRGWTLPVKSKLTGEYEQHRASPYFLATSRVRLREWEQLFVEAAKDATVGAPNLFGVDLESQWPEAKIVEYKANYTDADGKARVFPEKN